MTQTPAEQPSEATVPSSEPAEDYAGDIAEEVVRPEDNEPAADPEEE
jgi:hypothetical protein